MPCCEGWSEVKRVATDGLVQGDWVSGESLLALASLGAGKGTEVRVRASGVDAEEAVASLGRLIEDPVEPSAD